MKKTFFKKILQSRKRLALLILVMYTIYGAGVAEGLVLCVSDNGRVAIELDEKEFNAVNMEFCTMNEGKSDLIAPLKNARGISVTAADDSQKDCGDSCHDVDISISAVAAIAKIVRAKTALKISPLPNNVYAVLSATPTALFPLNRFLNDPVEYSHGVNSTLYSLSTVILLT